MTHVSLSIDDLMSGEIQSTSDETASPGGSTAMSVEQSNDLSHVLDHCHFKICSEEMVGCSRRSSDALSANNVLIDVDDSLLMTNTDRTSNKPAQLPILTDGNEAVYTTVESAAGQQDVCPVSSLEQLGTHLRSVHTTQCNALKCTNFSCNSNIQIDSNANDEINGIAVKLKRDQSSMPLDDPTNVIKSLKQEEVAFPVNKSCSSDLECQIVSPPPRLPPTMITIDDSDTEDRNVSRCMNVLGADESTNRLVAQITQPPGPSNCTSESSMVFFPIEKPSVTQVTCQPILSLLSHPPHDLHLPLVRLSGELSSVPSHSEVTSQSDMSLNVPVTETTVQSFAQPLASLATSIPLTVHPFPLPQHTPSLSNIANLGGSTLISRTASLSLHRIEPSGNTSSSPLVRHKPHIDTKSSLLPTSTVADMSVDQDLKIADLSHSSPTSHIASHIMSPRQDLPNTVKRSPPNSTSPPTFISSPSLICPTKSSPPSSEVSESHRPRNSRLSPTNSDEVNRVVMLRPAIHGLPAHHSMPPPLPILHSSNVHTSIGLGINSLNRLSSLNIVGSLNLQHNIESRPHAPAPASMDTMLRRSSNLTSLPHSAVQVVNYFKVHTILLLFECTRIEHFCG